MLCLWGFYGFVCLFLFFGWLGGFFFLEGGTFLFLCICPQLEANELKLIKMLMFKGQ